MSIKSLAVRAGCCLLVPLVLAGCATTSVFKAYPKHINPCIDGLDTGQIEPALDKLDGHRNGKDKVLFLMERGRVAQIANQADVSKVDFEDAIAAVRDAEEKAVLSASDAGATAASLLTNENAIPYEARGYEKVFLYHMQALNYLFEGDLEGASVEVRRANQEQELALDRHIKALDKAQKKQEKEKADWGTAGGNVDKAYSDMDAIVGKVKNSFQNAYTFYMSGIVWELMGEPNDAYIDYKKALEIYADNRYLQKDVLRLAKALGMNEDYKVFKQRFADVAAELEAEQPEAGAGELVVFFEDGFVPQMRDISIPLPTPDGLIGVAFPIYKNPGRALQPLEIYEGDQRLAPTEPVCDVYALAAKALKERLPMLLTREVLRAVSKAVLQKQAADQAGLFGAIGTSIYNIVTTGADLRAWYTLPNDVQVMRVALPEGEHCLRMVHGPTQTIVEPPVPIKANGKTIMRVVLCGSKAYYQTVVF